MYEYICVHDRFYKCITREKIKKLNIVMSEKLSHPVRRWLYSILYYRIIRTYIGFWCVFGECSKFLFPVVYWVGNGGVFLTARCRQLSRFQGKIIKILDTRAFCLDMHCIFQLNSMGNAVFYASFILHGFTLHRSYMYILYVGS